MRTDVDVKTTHTYVHKTHAQAKVGSKESLRGKRTADPLCHNTMGAKINFNRTHPAQKKTEK